MSQRFNLFNSLPGTTFAANTVIFEKGEQGTVMYFIRSGTVTVKDGDRVFDNLGEGDIFGEMALIDDEPRSGTAIAATDAELVVVNESTFERMVGMTPFFALNVMRVLVARLRRATKS